MSHSLVFVNQFFGCLKILSQTRLNNSEYWKRWLLMISRKKIFLSFWDPPIDPWNDQTAGKIRDVPHNKMCQKSAKVVRMKPTLPAHRFCFWHADLRCNEIRLEFLILSRYLRSSEPLRSTQTKPTLVYFGPPKPSIIIQVVPVDGTSMQKMASHTAQHEVVK